MPGTVLERIRKRVRSEIAKRTRESLPKVLDYLEGVILGEEEEEHYDTKTGTVFKSPVDHAVRIQAARMWRDMTLNKVIGDAKEKLQGKGQSGAADLKGALTEIAEQKKAELEAAAEQRGKLKRMGK